MIKIAYCGYDFFYNCFELLVNKKEVKVLKLFTFETDDIYNYNAKICKLATEHNIPISYERIRKEDLRILFDEMGCDYLISAAYPYKIPIENYKGINFHPTLLPLGRGPWPLPRVILSGQKENGVTFHKLIDKMDSGDIILQKKFRVNDREDLETLSCRCQLLAKQMMEELLPNISQLWNNAVPQGEGEYWEYPSDEEMTFDGSMEVDKIDRIIRAYGKFDSCVKFNGKSWLVWDANCWKETHNYQPGTIVHETNREYLMAVKDGFVCLRFFKEDK